MFKKKRPAQERYERKFIDKSPPSYYCCYDNMHVPRDFEDQVPTMGNGSEGRERERGNIAKYMGRVEHYMVSNTIEVASGVGVLE